MEELNTMKQQPSTVVTTSNEILTTIQMQKGLFLYILWIISENIDIFSEELTSVEPQSSTVVKTSNAILTTIFLITTPMQKGLFIYIII